MPLPETLAAICHHLDSSNAFIRRAAVDTLGEVSEKKDRAVVEKLRRLSDDEDYLSQMLRHGLGHRTMLPAACVQSRCPQAADAGTPAAKPEKAGVGSINVGPPLQRVE